MTRIRLLAGVLVLLLIAGFAPAFVAAHAHADEVTVSQDDLRTGWDQAESTLSSGSVGGSDFGQLFATQLNGQIYAQPLVVGGTLIVATDNDYVYGVDKATGAIEWTDDLGPSWPASTVGCGDLTPNVGVTSTPVYDPATGYVYLVGMINDGASASSPHWKMFAVDPATGAQRTGWPVTIQGYPDNDASRAFNSMTAMQRPGLLLMNGSVYAAFGSHCDYQPYVGYVVGVSTSTQTMHMWADEVGATSTEGGFWQSGGGIVSDGSGRMFVASGNGVAPTDGPGSSPPNQLAQSVIRLGVDSGGTIAPQDFFSPANATSLNTNDLDLGSGGPVALPDAEFGTTAVPHLMVEVGKDGRVFLLNRDHLGGRAQGSGGTDGVLQTIGPLDGVWGHPAVWGGDGGFVYVVGNQGNLTALKYGVNGSGAPALSIAGTSAATFGYSSGSPAVTSDGTTSGSALVWEVSVTGPTGAGGQLTVYNAVPDNGVMTLVRSFPIGNASKFSVPATDSGRVYVGTRDGVIYGFGQPTTAALTTTPVQFDDVGVGSSATQTATLTATAAVTVTAVSAGTGDFASGTPTPALPATLAKGDTLSVPITFKPSNPGAESGTLALTTSQGTIDVGLNGTGTRPGLGITPSPLAFGQVPVGSGSSLAETLSVTNTGTTAETVDSVTAPTGVFSATGLPAAGLVIAAGASVPVSVTFTPAAAQAYSQSLTITSHDAANDAHTATDALTGTGITGVKQLTVSPTTLSFGNVSLGKTAYQSFTITNSGNLALTIDKAAPPAAPFSVASPIAEGQEIAPGDSETVTVGFTPVATGAVSGIYQITADTGAGPQPVTMTATGVQPTSGVAVPTAGGGWTLNGSAAMSGSSVVLTTATNSESGSAVYGTPVATSGLTASFTASLGGGTGADGETFSVLDGSKASATSLGAHGGSLGLAGVDGLGVALVTYKSAGEPSANFVGITQLSSAWTLSWVATSTNIPNLRTGAHKVGVSFANCTVGTSTDSCTVAVSIDGAQALSAVTTVPKNSLPAFTAATGGFNDAHSVSNVSITAGGGALPVPGGGWSFNGNATMTGSAVTLNPAAANQVGSVIYPTAVAPDGLSADFTMQIGGGTGADGMTFALLNPADESGTSLGYKGGGMGALGMVGTYVVFNTYPKQEALIETVTSKTQTALTEVQTAKGIPDLRAGTHQVQIGISGSILTVDLDGNLILQAGDGLPSTGGVLVGFTGSTGTLTDAHTVTGVSITASKFEN
ncbi:MAG TPA: choice-of-anchor D domain-containing protein [Actinospica sp.]|nr:choice-of-anchor D domain-containing protein [Actinospica sp.]